jgi:NAD(P)-dependent dehydrogenase (short-subunit alcohol dehydrogenase family)
MSRYQDKKVVILGGTSGMGLATAKMLLDGGARVLVTGRSQAGLDSARQELGSDAIVVSSDARSLTDIDALAAQVKTEFDTIDLLFVNAGFSIPTPLANVTEDIYDEMFNLNAKGPFFAVQKLSPLINRGGSVVLTTRSPTSRDCRIRLHTEPPRPRCDPSLGCSPPSCFHRRSASTRCRPVPSTRAS